MRGSSTTPPRRIRAINQVPKRRTRRTRLRPGAYDERSLSPTPTSRRRKRPTPVNKLLTAGQDQQDWEPTLPPPFEPGNGPDQPNAFEKESLRTPGKKAFQRISIEVSLQPVQRVPVRRLIVNRFLPALHCSATQIQTSPTSSSSASTTTPLWQPSTHLSGASDSLSVGMHPLSPRSQTSAVHTRSGILSSTTASTTAMGKTRECLFNSAHFCRWCSRLSSLSKSIVLLPRFLTTSSSSPLPPSGCTPFSTPQPSIMGIKFVASLRHSSMFCNLPSPTYCSRRSIAWPRR